MSITYLEGALCFLHQVCYLCLCFSHTPVQNVHAGFPLKPIDQPKLSIRQSLLLDTLLHRLRLWLW